MHYRLKSTTEEGSLMNGCEKSEDNSETGSISSDSKDERIKLLEEEIGNGEKQYGDLKKKLENQWNISQE